MLATLKLGLEGTTISESGESEAATGFFRKRLRNKQEPKNHPVITSNRCGVI
jgi:hypothetical protein